MDPMQKSLRARRPLTWAELDRQKPRSRSPTSPRARVRTWRFGESSPWDGPPGWDRRATRRRQRVAVAGLPTIRHGSCRLPAVFASGCRPTPRRHSARVTRPGKALSFAAVRPIPADVQGWSSSSRRGVGPPPCRNHRGSGRRGAHAKGTAPGKHVLPHPEAGLEADPQAFKSASSRDHPKNDLSGTMRDRQRGSGQSGPEPDSWTRRDRIVGVPAGRRCARARRERPEH